MTQIDASNPMAAPKGRFALKPTRTRLVAVAAALSAIAIAAPLSTAAAATAPPAVPLAAAGQPGTVVGSTFVTVGPGNRTNMNIVTTSGNASSEA
jgi:hypothetical protein